MTRTHVDTNKLNRADFRTRHLAANHIGLHYDTDNGCYHEGWNDGRIVALVAAEIGHEVSIFTVQGVRREIYGNFKNKPSASSQGGMSKVARLKLLVEEQIKRIDALEATVGGLGLRTTSLEDAVTRPPVAQRSALPFPPQHAKRVSP